jgi:hypothetical protein
VHVKDPYIPNLSYWIRLSLWTLLDPTPNASRARFDSFFIRCMYISPPALDQPGSPGTTIPTTGGLGWSSRAAGGARGCPWLARWPRPPIPAFPRVPFRCLAAMPLLSLSISQTRRLVVLCPRAGVAIQPLFLINARFWLCKKVLRPLIDV